MNQNNEWPDWIAATAAALGIISVPIGWVIKRILGSVTRKEFMEYLKGRDELNERRDAIAEKRHEDNVGRLDTVIDRLSDTRERLSRMEGELTGKHT